MGLGERRVVFIVNVDKIQLPFLDELVDLLRLNAVDDLGRQWPICETEYLPEGGFSVSGGEVLSSAA